MSNKETDTREEDGPLEPMPEPPPQRLNDTEYHQLLELGYADLIKGADASARGEWADAHSVPIIEHWTVIVGEYILKVGNPPWLGEHLKGDGMDTVIKSDTNPDISNTAGVVNLNLSRTSETLQFHVDYVIPARRRLGRLDEITITADLLTPQRQQIQHRILFSGPRLVYWERNGEVGLDRSQKRPSS